MARYVKRYIVCFFSVLIVLALFVVFIHAGSGVVLALPFFKNALLILKANLSFIFFTVIFFTVYYFFQTKDFISFKNLFLSFLVISLLNSLLIGLFVYKPKPQDMHVYPMNNPGMTYKMKTFEINNVITNKDFFIRYKSFDRAKKIFKDLLAVNTVNGNSFSAAYASLLQTNNNYSIVFPLPYTSPGMARMRPFKISLDEGMPANPVLLKTLAAFHKISADFVFYKHLKIPMTKKKVFFFINIFLVVTGLSAIFMLFGLVTSLPSMRIVNIAISFSIIPAAYFAIYYLYKIPIYKLKFLNKGILTNINTGLLMLVIALILLAVSLFKVKSNSGREA